MTVSPHLRVNGSWFTPSDRKSAGLYTVEQDAAASSGNVLKILPLLWQNWSIPHSPVQWATHGTPLKLETVSPVFKSVNKSRSLAAQYRPSSAGQQIFWKKCWSSTTKLLGGAHCHGNPRLKNSLPISPWPFHPPRCSLVMPQTNLLMAKDSGLYTCTSRCLSTWARHVQHQTLINKLSEIGVCGLVIKWFISYSTDRQPQVRCGTSTSPPPHGLQPGSSIKKCPWTTPRPPVFTWHQMHSRNPTRISQVPTCCWRHSYLLQEEVTIKTRDIPVQRCLNFEQGPGNKMEEDSTGKCRQDESDALAPCHLWNPSWNFHRKLQPHHNQLSHPTRVLDSVMAH